MFELLFSVEEQSHKFSTISGLIKSTSNTINYDHDLSKQFLEQIIKGVYYIDPVILVLSSSYLAVVK